MAKISHHCADVVYKLRDKRKLNNHVKNLFREEGKELRHLSIILCSDIYLLQMNRQFLKHDYYTDIITFDLTQDDEEISGELYISLERVIENAKGEKVDTEEELRRVIFHGCLHLCGYGDKKKREITLMREKEAHYLRKFDEIIS